MGGFRWQRDRRPESEQARPSALCEPVRVLLRERCAGMADGSAAAGLGLTFEEMERTVLEVAERYCFGCTPANPPTEAEQLSFVSALHLEELMLARACAAGQDVAWDRFLTRYRETLYQAAYAITRQDALGRELADSLYAELYGLREKDGQRQSPLLFYHGRGSLAGWLRSVLAQRFVDGCRKTRRVKPLEAEMEVATPDQSQNQPQITQPEALSRLERAVAQELARLDKEQRFLLASYFLDGRTLKQIAGVLGVHESTVSRTLGRLTAALRKQIARNLRQSGLSGREVDEMLEVDVRDLEIQLKKILQGQEQHTFPIQQAQLLTAMEGGGIDG